jgi:hypothetical protein
MYKFNRTVTHHVYQGRVLHTLKLNHKTTSNCHSGVKNCFRMQIVYITNRIEISLCVCTNLLDTVTNVSLLTQVIIYRQAGRLMAGMRAGRQIHERLQS